LNHRQGCAVAGSARGVCLERVEAIKDYWFDWLHYNPQTTVYGHQLGTSPAAPPGR